MTKRVIAREMFFQMILRSGRKGFFAIASFPLLDHDAADRLT